VAKSGEMGGKRARGDGLLIGDGISLGVEQFGCREAWEITFDGGVEIDALLFNKDGKSSGGKGFADAGDSHLCARSARHSLLDISPTNTSLPEEISLV